MNITTFLSRLIARRQGATFILLGFFVVISQLTRLFLLCKSIHSVDFDHSLFFSLGWGFLFDVAAGVLFIAPAAILLAILPKRFFVHTWGRFLAHVGFGLFLAVLIFIAVAEYFFWNEFSARFNFIAVDYLVYTHEVVNNIRESYPMPLIFAGIICGSALLYWLSCRTGLIRFWMNSALEGARKRWLFAGGWSVMVLLAILTIDSEMLPGFSNNYHRELAKNGIWAFCAAFRNNELDYEQFYSTLPLEKAFQTIHAEISSDGSSFVGKDPYDTLRIVHNDGPPLKLNVIQITVESLSASFLGSFNPKSRLTPGLDAIAKNSLVFDNFYATGTRTDRGMEALTLSLPPTPGRSLVKRPHNENLFTLGSVFRSQGYDTAFLYGGYGYFDNMNYFFGHNGYRIVDRAAVDSSDITFANAWGACDEDLFHWTLREADRSYTNGKPFFYFVMTTSNHRPYTYPDNRIDLPSKISGRDGAVKYTDFAIAKLIQDAQSHPWFSNTVFVIVADHCASVAGKSEIPVPNYHIPLIIYTPGGQIAAGHIPDLASQIDYAPTLLGLLNWSYAERFYGWDIRKAKGDRRALIGNYQRLGLFEPGILTVLRPQQGADEYSLSPFTLAQKRRDLNPTDLGETISYYQTASYLYRKRLFQELTPEENARALALIH